MGLARRGGNEFSYMEVRAVIHNYNYKELRPTLLEYLIPFYGARWYKRRVAGALKKICEKNDLDAKAVKVLSWGISITYFDLLGLHIAEIFLVIYLLYKLFKIF